MYVRMLLSGQDQGNIAGDLRQEQIPLSPSKDQIKQEGITVYVAQGGKEPQTKLTLGLDPSCSGLSTKVLKSSRKREGTTTLAKLCY